MRLLPLSALASIAAAVGVALYESFVGRQPLVIVVHALLIASFGFVPGSASGGRAVPWIISTAVWWSVPLLAVLVQAVQVRYGGDWDLMFLSGLTALVVGIAMSGPIPARFAGAMNRICARQALRLGRQSRQAVLSQLAARSRQYERYGAVGVGSAVGLGWIVVLLTDPMPISPRLWAMVLETFAATVGGARLGRMAAYGSFWRTIRDERGRLIFRDGHPDGVGGLSPLGRFCFHQSLIAGIPALYLTLWWFLIPLWPDYNGWRDVFVALLPLAVLFEVLAFVIPLTAVHADMQRTKRRRLRWADRISVTIDRLARRQAAPGLSADDRAETADRIAALTELHGRLENMRTWPVDVTVRRWLTFNNALALFPLLDYFVHVGGIWEAIIEVVTGLHH